MEPLILAWGECDVLVKNISTKAVAPPWKVLHKPVEDSTSLEPTQGDKTEALVEGGEREAVRYKKNTYALSLQVRVAPGVPLVLEDEDGVVEDQYSVVVIPKNQKALGIYIERAEANILKRYSSADGITAEYTFDVLRASSGTQVKIGRFDATFGEDKAAKLDFYELTASSGEEGSKVDLMTAVNPAE